jgi:hypothetical protein
LNVHRASDIRHIKIHTAQPLVPDPSPFDINIVVAKLKKFKSPGSDQIPAGGSVIHKLRVIDFVWNKVKLPDQWKESITVPVHRRAIKLTVVIIGV